jgi:hypothetical protein
MGNLRGLLLVVFFGLKCLGGGGTRYYLSMYLFFLIIIIIIIFINFNSHGIGGRTYNYLLGRYL